MLVLVGTALIEAGQQLGLIGAHHAVRHHPAQHLGEAELVGRDAGLTSAGHAPSLANVTAAAGYSWRVPVIPHYSFEIHGLHPSYSQGAGPESFASGSDHEVSHVVRRE